MSAIETNVAIVGGGISGLVCAWTLARAGTSVALLEASNELGGCMRTSHGDGVLFEHGPFNVLARAPAFVNLLQACESDVGVVSLAEASRKRYLAKRGALHAIPMSPWGWLKSPLLSPMGRLRLLRGALVSRRAPKREETIHEAATRRLGRDAAEVLVSSAVAGVFGGDSKQTSLAAAFPHVSDVDRQTRSPLMAMVRRAKQRKRSDQTRPAMISFKNGLQSLADWLGANLSDGVYREHLVSSIVPRDNGWHVHAKHHGREVTVEANKVVLTTPARATGLLVRELAPNASEELISLPTSTMAVVNLLYARNDVAHPLDGYGFLVPNTESQPKCLGALFADAAFPHHAPEHQCIVRVFLGGHREPDILARTDKELRAQARESVEPLLGISAQPRFAPVMRWPRAIPQYAIGHAERMATVERDVARLPGLHLVGNYLRGVSINDCVREADALARRILAGEAS